MADPVVLAKDAAQIAKGEKDVSRTLRPRDGRFLPEMGPEMSHPDISTGPAEPALARKAVNTAMPGAQGAVRKHGKIGLHGK
jgi:hypothetical protein